MTGKNLSLEQSAVEEKRQLLKIAPFYVKGLKGILNVARLTEKFLSGAYFQKMPLEYSIYTEEIEEQN